MSDVRLGEILTGEHQRDAVHVAVAPVIAAERLHPGERIGFYDEGTTLVCASADAIGIVDPFLPKDVEKDQQFFMFLFPGTVTGMRHHWSHPAFGPDKPAAPTGDKAASEAWLRKFAVQMNPYIHDEDAAYEHLMEGLRMGSLHSRGSEYGSYEYDAEFFGHASIVMGRALNPDDMSYSCSC